MPYVEAPYLPYHATQAAAVLSLLQAHPEGVTISMFCNFLYTTKKGRTVGLGWESRARIAELRHDHHIEHGTNRQGESAWFYRGPRVEAGQMLLAVGA